MRVEQCPVTTCMWHCSTGVGCSYRENVSSLAFAVEKGLSVKEAKEKIRKAELKIQKGMIIEAYVNYIHDNNLANPKHNQRKDMRYVCSKTKSLAWNKAFNVDVATFVAMCSSRNFKAFSKLKGIDMSLTAILGIRGIHRDSIRACLGKRKATMAENMKIRNQRRGKQKCRPLK